MNFFFGIAKLVLLRFQRKIEIKIEMRLYVLVIQSDVRTPCACDYRDGVFGRGDGYNPIEESAL